MHPLASAEEPLQPESDAAETIEVNKREFEKMKKDIKDMQDTLKKLTDLKVCTHAKIKS